MNELEYYFENNQGRMIHKWQHYFDIYEKHFSRYKGTDVHILEIGVFQGGSLQMWKDYFGPKCKIYGVDINPHCEKLAEDQIEIIVGDQENRDFLRQLRNRVPRIDILIDDGGHTAKQQINTFDELFDAVEPDGIYLCEDLHTSYWSDFGSGYKNKKSFIEYSKHFIDQLHAWHFTGESKVVSSFTKSVKSLHYYDSILVIEKQPITQPYRVKTGEETIPYYIRQRGFLERVHSRLMLLLRPLLRPFGFK